ncbi:reverse transcriptase [Tanacetum coccineum]
MAPNTRSITNDAGGSGGAPVVDENFEKKIHDNEISEDHAISLFIGGLPVEIAMAVRMFKLRKLADAYCLTNLQEATINAVKKMGRMMYNAQGNNIHKPLLPNPYTTTKLAPKNNRKQLTQKEYQEKRDNNQCFYCGKRYTPGHKCSGQMYALEVLAGSKCEEECLGEEELEELGEGKKMVLRGTPKSNLEWITNSKQAKMLKQNSQPEYSSMQLCVFPGPEISLMRLEGISTEVKPELQSMIQEFKEIFSLPTVLPPNRSCDHKIPLLEGSQLVNVRPYRHPPTQKDAIEGMVQELLDTGVIRPSNSPFSSLIVMVKKKDNTWRICMDYRLLNKQTIKDKFPIPIIEELIDELHGSQVFTKLDLRSGYHQIRMCVDDVAKTAFKTHHGHYEFLVMPFGLTNAPSTFQALMNEVFQLFLRKFVLVFFDDILIYSKSLEEHVVHLRNVLEVMKTHQLYAKLSKCVFGTKQVEYLGHVISAEGVSTDPTKIKAMEEWPVPSNVKQLRGFLGLTGYYRRFIKAYASISRPLTLLLKKNSFQWNEESQVAFESLKKAMISAPVLALPDFDKEFTVETDASGIGIGAVLIQGGHPIAYLNTWEEDNELKAKVDKLKKGESVRNAYVWENHQLRRKGKLVVGNNATLRMELLTHFHSGPIGGHVGIKATMHKLCSLFYWGKIRREIKQFVRNCDVCQRSKPDLSAYPGLLQPLPIPNTVWSSISMDFVEGLPKSQGKNVIMLHGLPESIVSDRDKVFISTFWKELFKLLHVKLLMSTAYHPQTDGQTEVVNRGLECYLRCMCGETPKDWGKWLSLAEWWYNTNYYLVLKTTPYEVLYGQTPPIHILYVSGESRVDTVDRALTAREEVIKALIFHLKRSQEMMKTQADKHRSEREFAVRDWIYLKL